jgi:hypothetical protein
MRQPATRIKPLHQTLKTERKDRRDDRALYLSIQKAIDVR